MKYRIFLNLIVVAVLIVGTSEFSGLRLDLAETLERQSYDWRLEQSRPKTTRRDDIVIIDIDAESLKQIGQWPWSRDPFTQLTDNLFSQYKVQAAAFTIPFVDSDNDSEELLGDVEGRLNQRLIENSAARSGSWMQGARETIRWLDTLRADYNYDRRFAQAMVNYPIVLSYVFSDSNSILGGLPYAMRFNLGGKDISASQARIYTEAWAFKRGYTGVYRPLLSAADNNAGFTNLSLDSDGVVRRAPLFTRHAGEFYASFPLMVVRRIQGHDSRRQIEMRAATTGRVFDWARVGGYELNLNTDGEIYIRYLNSGGKSIDFSTSPTAVFRYISASDVISGKARSDLLKDRIALVGSSVLQEDLYTTPVNPSMPLVEIAATQVANFIDENVLYRPNHAPLYEAIALVGIATLLALLFVFMGPLTSGIVLAAVFGGIIYYVLGRWNDYYEVWSLTPPLIVLSGLFAFNAITGFIEEWRSSQHLQSTFGQYLPPEVAKQVGSKDSVINLEGEEKELSVLFSDIRNFTSISENLSPRDLTRFMNRMLTAISEEIHQCNGTVDKYIGDAVMAFWNAPLDDPNHAKNSILAAFGMQKAILNISNDLVAKGFSEIRLGVGIATGNANVGNMGSTLRMAYTAIGDTVNLASRVEGMTKYYYCPILVTEATREQCKSDFAFRSVDLVQVKGRVQPVTMYEPIGPSQLVTPPELATVKAFEAMRDAYTQGAFAEAQEMLTAYAAANPQDQLANVYQERITHLLAHPPENWDGVMTHTTK